jgi:arylsulfatase A-like enzyme
LKLLRQALATGLVGGATWGALEAGLGLLQDTLPPLLERGLLLPTSSVDALSVCVLAAADYALVCVLFVLLAAPVVALACAWDEKHLAAPRALVAGAVFVNLYWWTKPWWAFSWGLPFHHPARLAQSAGWLAVAGGLAFLTVRDARRPLPWRGLLAVGLLALGVAGGVLDLVGTMRAAGAEAPAAGLWERLGARLDQVPLHERLRTLLGWGAGGALLALAAWRTGWWSVPRRGALITVSVVLLAGGGAALVRDRRLAEGAGRPAPAGRPPNVLLVINDALRADRLGCYGNRRDPPVSPRTDALAAEGVVFEHAITQAPFTWTSFGSFLTGKYPRHHGLLNMLPNERLDPKANRTVAAALAEAGYVTGAFMTGTLSNNSGLLAGFDTYFEAIVGHDPVSRASKWSIVRSELLLRRLRNKLRQALDPRLVNTMALDWIEAHAGRPFFAMVHYYATHTPYDPPEPYGRLYDPDYTGPFHPFTQSHGVAVLRALQETPPREIFTPRDLEHLVALYDGGVAFQDEMLGALLDRLDALGVGDDTLVIVTSDHGEELYDHGVFEHDWMFNTNLVVPLVVRLPGRARAGTRVAWPVELIDLPPTILDVVGHGTLATPEDPRAGEVAGRSLLPDGAGTAPEAAEHWAFSENNRYVAMQDTHCKIIVNRLDPGQPPRVFDLRADPGERAPLAGSPLEAGLLARLSAWDRTMPGLDSLVTHAADPELARILAQTGYLGPNAMREESLQPVPRAAAPPPAGDAPVDLPPGGCGP